MVPAVFYAFCGDGEVSKGNLTNSSYVGRWRMSAMFYDPCGDDFDDFTIKINKIVKLTIISDKIYLWANVGFMPCA